MIHLCEIGIPSKIIETANRLEISNRKK